MTPVGTIPYTSFVGRTRKALELNQQVLEIQRMVLGDNHRDTLDSIRLRLEILRDLGMTEEFRALAPVALVANERVLGVDHPYTLLLRKEFGPHLALL
jgi:hypothetical protein